MTEPLFDGPALAELLGLPERTPEQWRYLGRGPKFMRVGRHIRYRESDVLEWMKAHTVDPSEPKR